MKTTLNIEDELLSKAAFLTGVSEKTSLVRMGLQALIAKESAKRLALLGGSEKRAAQSAQALLVAEQKLGRKKAQDLYGQ